MATKGFDPVSVVFLLLILGVFYVLMILPMQRKQKQHEAMLKALKKGDKIITNGGIHGTITQIKDHVVHLKIADKTEIIIDKSAIAGVIKKKEE